MPPAAAPAPGSLAIVKTTLVGEDAAGFEGAGAVRDVAAPVRPANFAVFKSALVAAYPGLDAAACQLFVLFPGPGLSGRLVEVQIDADSDVEALK